MRQPVREEFHRVRPRLVEQGNNPPFQRAWVTTAPAAYDYDLVTRGETLGTRRGGAETFQVVRFSDSPEATSYRIQYQLDRYRSGSYFVCPLDDWHEYEYMVESEGGNQAACPRCGRTDHKPPTTPMQPCLGQIENPELISPETRKKWNMPPLGEARLEASRRETANANLRHAGMDGNVNFETAGEGFNVLASTLEKHGIEMVDLFPQIQSDPAQPYPDGFSQTSRLRVAFSNPQNAFAPEEIDNSILHMTVYKKREGAWEIVAYLS